MSTVDLNFEFFNLPITKSILHITDNTEDAYLRGTLGLKAERWVKNNLSPYATSFPLSQENQESAISMACSYAAAKYKKANNNFEAAKSFMEDANEELKSLIILFKSAHSPRTRIVSASQDYDTEDDVLFSQRIIR